MAASVRGVALCGALVLTASVEAQDQFGSILAPPQYWTTKPGEYVPLIADVLEQTTYRTPWGTFVEKVRGKFWRTRDGTIRQDHPFGTTEIRTKTNDIVIDHLLKTAMVQFASDARGPGTPWSGADVRIAVMNSRDVAGRRTSGPDGSDEDWSDLRWGVGIQKIYKTPSTDFAAQLVNVIEQDPDPGLFRIPDGYRVISCLPAKGVKLPSECPEGLPLKPASSR